MKKFLLLFTVVLLLAGCSMRPPMVKLTSGETKIPAELGSYAWRSLNKAVISDSAGPWYQMEKEKAVTLQAGAEVKASFSKEPKRLILSRWEGNEAVEETELASNTFTVPTDAGEFVYSIRAEWGSAKSGTFAFKIEIE